MRFFKCTKSVMILAILLILGKRDNAPRMVILNEFSRFELATMKSNLSIFITLYKNLLQNVFLNIKLHKITTKFKIFTNFPSPKPSSLLDVSIKIKFLTISFSFIIFLMRSKQNYFSLIQKSCIKLAPSEKKLKFIHELIEKSFFFILPDHRHQVCSRRISNSKAWRVSERENEKKNHHHY